MYHCELSLIALYSENAIHHQDIYDQVKEVNIEAQHGYKVLRNLSICKLKVEILQLLIYF